MRRRGALAAALLLALGAAAPACDCNGRDRPPDGVADAGAPDAAPPPAARTLVDFVEELPACDVDHRGLLLDAGTGSLVGRFGWREGRPPGVRSIEREAATWIRVSDRTLEVSFRLPEATPIFAAVQARGGSARAASVLLDGQPLGTLHFQKDQARVASTPTTTLPADAGLHTLTLRFSGRLRDPEEGFADIAWIRIGVPDDNPATYGPPTLRDAVSAATALGGVPHRSIALRAPAAVRCALRPAPGMRVRLAAGLLGAGQGRAAVRLLRDGMEPVTLQVVELQGGEGARWTDVDLPLDAYAGTLAELELAVLDAPPGARVLLGDPAVVSTAPEPAPVPAARAVVVVVLSGVERADLPPWNTRGEPALPALASLVAEAAVFDDHRAPTTVAAGVVASMLTALPPATHGVIDSNARLPGSLSTLATVARDDSVRTAMFTGVPGTFGAFGFAASWEQFVEHPASSGDSATTPLDRAVSFIGEISREDPPPRLLAAIHARGGHPPWEVSQRELTMIPPSDYAGPIDPRRAAQVLGRLRKRRQTHLLGPVDRERIVRLSAVALGGQDRALENLLAALKAANLWDDVLLIVTADVSSGASEQALYGDGLELREAQLALPLYVRFPGGRHAGTRVSSPTEAVDIARTVATALGVAFSRPAHGADLSAVAAGLDPLGRGPRIALLPDRFAARWGDLVLSGKLGAAPSLCDLEVDPTCVFNRRDAMPLSVQAISRRVTREIEVARRGAPARESVDIDPEIAAQLEVWGAD